MTDSTNPRVLADNIRVLSGVSGSQASDISALQTLITSLVTWSTNETDTGITYKGEKVYSKIVSDTTPTVETAGTAVSKYVDFISGAHPILMIGTVSSENYMSNTPTFDSGGRVVRLFYNFATEKITIVSSANSFNAFFNLLPPYKS